jgi:hypothetical protein
MHKYFLLNVLNYTLRYIAMINANFLKFDFLILADIFSIFMENILLLLIIFENWKIIKRLKVCLSEPCVTLLVGYCFLNLP